MKTQFYSIEISSKFGNVAYALPFLFVFRSFFNDLRLLKEVVNLFTGIKAWQTYELRPMFLLKIFVKEVSCMEVKKHCCDLVGVSQLDLGNLVIFTRLLAREGVSLVLGYLPKRDCKMILSDVVGFDFEADYENGYLKIFAYPTVSDLKEFDIAFGWDCYAEKRDGSKELIEMSNDFRKEVLDWIASDVSVAILQFIMRALLSDESKAYIRGRAKLEIERMKASNSKKYQEVLAS